MSDDLQSRLAIRELVENWALWRDAGDWERFRTVWHDDGRMMATWFQGSADEFIRVSREGWDRGVSILHFLGGSCIDVAGDRAIAQTKMTISQRGDVHGVAATSCAPAASTIFSRGVTAAGGSCCASRSTRRTASTRSTRPRGSTLDGATARPLPRGYRHLAYIQTQIGYTVKRDMPGLKGPKSRRCTTRGRAWLQGEAL